MKLLSKIDKVSAWVLLFCFLAYIVSGFDIQLRFLSPQVTSFFHLKYLFIPALAAFAIHTTYAIHLAMKRRNYWNMFGKILLSAYGVLHIFLFLLFLKIQLSA